MAKIKVQEVLDHLDRDLRIALARAVQSEIPGAVFDERSLFRAFSREAYKKCSIWESVPDQYVEND